MDEAETEMKYDSEEMDDVEEKKQMNDQGNDAAEDPLAAAGLEDCDADDDVGAPSSAINRRQQAWSIRRLGGAGAVAQLVADVPLSSVEGGGFEGGDNQTAWEKWSSGGTEQQVAKLMEEDVGAAMQFLQSKALCIMPVSLASAIYHTHQSDTPTIIKPEPNAPS